MLRRRMARAGVAIGMLAVSILGLSSPASAAPTSFVSKAVHASGAGKLAVQATGGLSWYSRSVTATSVRFYANAGECGYVSLTGWQGNASIDYAIYPSSGYYCGGATGKWFNIGNVTLDGSAVSGGITEVIVIVFDVTHAGQGYADCYRSASVCTSYQW